MTQWSVVLVLSSLATLISLLTRPMLSLTQAITKLTTSVEKIEQAMDEMSIKNKESHKRLWQHNTIQDQTLAEQDKRIIRLEDKA